MSYLVDGIDVITPMHLEPARVGRYSITVETIKAGTKVDIISIRNAMFGGLKCTAATFDKDLRVHKLRVGDSKESGVWTSDHPLEIYTQAIEFRHCHGHVLVGGLGIGMAAVMIARQPNVEKVTVVEIEPDVIKLVEPQLPKIPFSPGMQNQAPINIVRADLFKYIPKHINRFDTCYFDIWAPTGERAWMEYVVPLRRLVYQHAHKTVPVYNWLEREMVGQVKHALTLSLQGVQMMEEATGNPDLVAQWKQHWKVNGVFYTVADKYLPKDYKGLVSLYAEGPGTREWERVFGKTWDTWKPKKKNKVAQCQVDPRA